MPGPTKAELAGEISRQLQELSREFSAFRSGTEVRLNQHDVQLAERVRVDDFLQQKFAEVLAENAALRQRCAALEKQGDRNWQAWLALAGAGLALLVALLKK